MPDNSELAKHHHMNDNNHDVNDNLNLTILQNNIKITAARSYHEDKRICRLNTISPYDLNTEIGDYAKGLKNLFRNELRNKFRIMLT